MILCDKSSIRRCAFGNGIVLLGTGTRLQLLAVQLSGQGGELGPVGRDVGGDAPGRGGGGNLVRAITMSL